MDSYGVGVYGTAVYGPTPSLVPLLPNLPAIEASEWQLFARDQLGARRAELSAYGDVNLLAKFNDVGTFQLTVPMNEPAVGLLMTPGYGIEFVRGDVIFLSGPIVIPQRVCDKDRNDLVVAGVDDMVWLDRRLGHPQPASSGPPYSTFAADVQTAQIASTAMTHYVDVNAGPGAIAARQVPGLTLAADPMLGPTVDRSAQWENLLEITQELAALAGLGFRVVGLEFQIYDPEDKSSTIVFSQDLGTLGPFSYQQQAAKSNYEYVGGSGDGTSRVYREREDMLSILDWGRIEGFVNKNNTDVTDELDQAGDVQLAKDAAPTGVSLTPIDKPGMTFGVDYGLGDIVAAVVDGVTFTDVISQVAVKLDGDGETLTPRVGEAPAPLRIFDQVAVLQQQLRNLERH